MNTPINSACRRIKRWFSVRRRDNHIGSGDR
jgi:hypothetical protein